MKVLNPRNYTTKNIEQALPKNIDFKAKTGFSFEDINARMMVLLTIYIPQGLTSIYYRQNPFETWSRNALAFTGAIVLASFSKHPKFGFGKIANLIMLPKVKNGTFWDKVWNPIRPTKNYLQTFDRYGINLKSLGVSLSQNKSKKEIAFEMDEAVRKKFFHATLDNNMRTLLYNERDQLKQQITGLSTLSSAKRRLAIKEVENLKTQLASAVPNTQNHTLISNQLARLKTLINPIKINTLAKQTEYKELNHLLKLMLASQILNSTLTSILFTVIVGILMQAAVFKYISPLDRKLTPRTKYKPPLPVGIRANPILPTPKRAYKPPFTNVFPNNPTLVHNV